jgi:PAS domain-containing protein
MPERSERILTLVESILKAATLEAVVQAGARSMGEVVEAPLSGIVVLIHGRVFLEAWQPDYPPRARDPFQNLRGMAVQTAQHGTAAFMPLDGPGMSLMARALHMPLGHRLNGAICVVTPQDAEADLGAGISIERLAGVIALRINDLLEFEAERRKSQQFERWFKVSDRQIRALDLERQKFAALVSSFAGGAFVADRKGTITWQTRPLLDRAGGPNDTWVGRPCQELCETLGGGDRSACEQCLVTRVLGRGQPAAHDVVVLEAGEEHLMRAAAAPINDLSGQAQEVIVTFQEIQPAPRREAA